MATWSNQTKNTPTFTNLSLSQVKTFGSPLGLLLVITNSELAKTLWDNQTKNSPTFTNQTKN